MSNLELLKQVKKAQKRFVDIEEQREQENRERIAKRDERFKAFNDVVISIKNDLADLLQLPLHYYYWSEHKGGWTVGDVRHANFDFYTIVNRYSYNYGPFNIIEDTAKDILNKDIYLINGGYNDHKYKLYFTVTEEQGKYSFRLVTDVFNVAQVEQGLNIKPDFHWMSRLNNPSETSFVDPKRLTKTIRETVLQIISIERLEEMMTQTKLKTVLADFLKIEIDKIKLSEKSPDNVGVRFDVEGKGEFRVLDKAQRHEYQAKIANANKTKYFNVELAAEFSSLSMQDWVNVRKNLSSEAFALIAKQMISERYGEKYSELHSFADAIAPFGNHFIVDCSKV